MTQPQNQPPIDAVVLAAGTGQRMQKPKSQLEVDGRTFLEQAIKTLRTGGARYVVAVLNGADDWAERLADASGAAVVINDDPNAEQHDSIRVGLAALPEDSAGALILPVDVPLVRAETIATLIEAFHAGGASIVRPVSRGTAGHPTVFARVLYDELSRNDLAEGARTVIAAHASEVRDVSVQDDGVAIDIDTPDDYRQHIGGSDA